MNPTPMIFELLHGFDLRQELLALGIIAFNSLLAAAGGIGGGPVYTSVLMAFGADAHTAIPIP